MYHTLYPDNWYAVQISGVDRVPDVVVGQQGPSNRFNISGRRWTTTDPELLYDTQGTLASPELHGTNVTIFCPRCDYTAGAVPYGEPSAHTVHR